MLVLAYHSLEDRIVKERFAEWAGSARARAARVARRARAPRGSCACSRAAPCDPRADEVAANPRARSARLRAAEKLAAPHRVMTAIADPRRATRARRRAACADRRPGDASRDVRRRRGARVSVDAPPSRDARRLARGGVDARSRLGVGAAVIAVLHDRRLPRVLAQSQVAIDRLEQRTDGGRAAATSRRAYEHAALASPERIVAACGRARPRRACRPADARSRSPASCPAPPEATSSHPRRLDRGEADPCRPRP